MLTSIIVGIVGFVVSLALTSLYLTAEVKWGLSPVRKRERKRVKSEKNDAPYTNPLAEHFKAKRADRKKSFDDWNEEFDELMRPYKVVDNRASGYITAGIIRANRIYQGSMYSYYSQQRNSQVDILSRAEKLIEGIESGAGSPQVRQAMLDDAKALLAEANKWAPTRSVYARSWEESGYEVSTVRTFRGDPKEIRIKRHKTDSWVEYPF